MSPTSMIEEMFTSGGTTAIVLAVCFAISVAIVCGRLFHFHRAQIDVHEFIRGLFNVLKRNRVAEAIAICDDTPGPVAHAVRAVILSGDREEIDMRRAADEVSYQEVPRLERHLRLLATIGYISPLIGLLGTVSGLLGVFATIEDKGHFVETIRLGQYVKQALVTTGGGLMVAIVAVAAYNYLVGRVEAIVLDVEKATAEMIVFLTRNPITLENVAGVGTQAFEEQAAHEDEDHP